MSCLDSKTVEFWKAKEYTDALRLYGEAIAIAEAPRLTLVTKGGSEINSKCSHASTANVKHISWLLQARLHLKLLLFCCDCGCPWQKCVFDEGCRSTSSRCLLLVTRFNRSETWSLWHVACWLEESCCVPGLFGRLGVLLSKTFGNLWAPGDVWFHHGSCRGRCQSWCSRGGRD